MDPWANVAQTYQHGLDQGLQIQQHGIDQRMNLFDRFMQNYANAAKDRLAQQQYERQMKMLEEQGRHNMATEQHNVRLADLREKRESDWTTIKTKQNEIAQSRVDLAEKRQTDAHNIALAKLDEYKAARLSLEDFRQKNLDLRGKTEAEKLALRARELQLKAQLAKAKIEASDAQTKLNMARGLSLDQPVMRTNPITGVPYEARPSLGLGSDFFGIEDEPVDNVPPVSAPKPSQAIQPPPFNK